MSNSDVVIVGAGWAGHALARALRQRDPECAITLIGAHDGALYAKAALASALCPGRDPGSLVQATAEMVAARNHLQLLVGSRVEAIDPDEGCVIIGRQRIHYRQLVLATGEATPTAAGLERALVVDRMADYQALLARLRDARTVLVIGCGAAACEFANDVVASGRQAIIVDGTLHPLGSRLPELAAERFRQGLASAGVRFSLDDRVLSIAPRRRGACVHTACGDRFEVDLVVNLAEREARLELAGSAGLEHDRRGISVDAQLRTSLPGIFAIGACAALPVRIRHADADAQALALAATLCGSPSLPSFRPRPLRLHTPACPLALFDPLAVSGEWQERATADGVVARFVDRGGQLRGFALVANAADDCDQWTKRLTGR